MICDDVIILVSGLIYIYIYMIIVPREIEKRGKEAIAKFVADLRKGKAKMPRCKLMILGEAGVGKTSFLSLLTGEPFNPEHNETEGVDTDFVCTSNICSVTWKKKAMEGDEEYKEVAAKRLAQNLILADKEQPAKPEKKKRTALPSHATLEQQFESLVEKYTKPKESSTSIKPKSKQPQISSHRQLSSHSSGSFSRFPPMYPQALPPQPLPQPVVYSRAPAVSMETVVPMEIEPPHPPRSLQKPHHAVTTSTIATSTQRPGTRTKDTASPRQPSLPTSTDPDHVQTDIMRRAVKLKKMNSSDDKQVNLPLKFSSFDFAGQKHYKPMHHCFLTSRSVYVVAFNVRHLLGQQQGHCIEELKFWINSIHIYTDDVAKIVLVGTHRGPYPGICGDSKLDQLTLEQEKSIHNIIKDNFNKQCYAGQISWFEMHDGSDGSEIIIAMVENSLRGKESGADVIRQKLLELGDQYPGNNDDLPTSYLRLEHKIFEKRKKTTLTTREEVAGWAREFGVDDPSVALTFFHDIGTIIDPSELLLITVDHLLLYCHRETTHNICHQRTAIRVGG